MSSFFRYKEQKWRLSKCGVLNVIYLVEELNSRHWAKEKRRGAVGESGRGGLNPQMLDSAVATTAMMDR